MAILMVGAHLETVVMLTHNSNVNIAREKILPHQPFSQSGLRVGNRSFHLVSHTAMRNTIRKSQSAKGNSSFYAYNLRNTVKCTVATENSSAATSVSISRSIDSDSVPGCLGVKGMEYWKMRSKVICNP